MSHGRSTLVALVDAHFAYHYEKSGTKKMARNVAANIPPNTPVPMEFRLAAPAPEAITNGNTPRIKAMEVMMIGRNRSRAASSAASTNGLPSA